jgi:hypothetical protein
MLVIYLVVVGMIIGTIASGGRARTAVVYVPAALLGALLGAFAAFGDARFLLRHPLVNPFTLGLVGSVGVVAVLWAWQQRRTP